MEKKRRKGPGATPKGKDEIEDLEAEMEALPIYEPTIADQFRQLGYKFDPVLRILSFLMLTALWIGSMEIAEGLSEAVYYLRLIHESLNK